LWILSFYFPDLWLVLEEAHLFMSPWHTYAGLLKILRYGRHRAINQIYISPRLSEVHRLVTAQADHILFFRMQDYRDIQTASHFLGSEAKKLPALQTGEFILYPPKGA